MTTRTVQLYAGPVSAGTGGGGTVVYTVPSGFRTIVKRLHTFCLSTGERLIVQEQNPAGTELVRIVDATLPTAATDDFEFWLVMNQGERINMLVPGGAGTTFVNLSGTELELT